MSGYRSSDFRHSCPRDGCLQDQLPSWDWMKDCFPRGIMPTDVDGMVEINGHFLFIEQKRAGVSLGGGQSAAFRALSRKDNVTVWCIRPTADPDKFEAIVRDGMDEPSGWQPYSVDDLRLWLATWARAAERAA